MESGSIGCPHCGGIHPEKALFCPVVGKMIHLTCPQCGSRVDIAWIKCVNCGTPLQVGSTGRQESTKKRKKTKRILTILLLSGLFLLIFSFTAMATSDIFLHSENSQINQLLLQVRQTLFPNRASAPVVSDHWEEYDLNEGSTVSQVAEEVGSLTPLPEETPIPTEVSVPPTESLTITPTSTVNPSSTPTIVPLTTVTKTPESGPWLACPGTYLSHLHPGDRAKISEDPPLSNRVRSSPGTGNKVVGTLKPGERIEILEGPSCFNDMVWWRIRSLQNDLTGWTSEGDSDDYWIITIP